MDLPRLASIQKRLLSWQELCDELAVTHPLVQPFRELLLQAKTNALVLWEKKGTDGDSQKALLLGIVQLEKIAEEVRVQAVAHTPLKKPHTITESSHD
jgi:hypothetical protein